MKLSTTQKELRIKSSLTKTALAKATGISRTHLYYRHRLPEKDWGIKQLIELALREHPAYGHKRLAGHLNINKKRILRVMKIFSIKPYRRRGRKWRAANRNSVFFPNLLLVKRPTWPNHVWASDFTHISFSREDSLSCDRNRSFHKRNSRLLGVDNTFCRIGYAGISICHSQTSTTIRTSFRSWQRILFKGLSGHH